MIDREKHAQQLPDGTDVCDTLTAANEYGATPPAFIAAAKKAGLRRWATRSPRGQICHYWAVDEVEDLRRQRFAAFVEIEAESPFVEAPYEVKGR